MICLLYLFVMTIMTQFSFHLWGPQWVFSELKFADYYIVWLHLSSECEFLCFVWKKLTICLNSFFTDLVPFFFGFRNSDGDDFPHFPFVNTQEQNLFLKSSMLLSIELFPLGFEKKVPWMLLTELFLLSQHWVFFFNQMMISSFQKL